MHSIARAKITQIFKIYSHAHADLLRLQRASWAIAESESQVLTPKMAKRAADDDEQTSPGALKGGERPIAGGAVPEGEQFEDEFEDEFESEDEVLEAGVDGRPDEEREAEERANGNAIESQY